jgi:hypothetical protein
VTSGADWAGYLAAYHDANPGITEDLLAEARDAVGRTRYDWLVEAVGGTFLRHVAEDEADLLVAGFYAPGTAPAEVRRAAAWLRGRVSTEGPVPVGYRIRRLVAVRTSFPARRRVRPARQSRRWLAARPPT